MLYRIITENKNGRTVAAIVKRHFADFTLLNATGYWRGQREKSLIIEIETKLVKRVTEAARAIKRHNRQFAVLIQRLPNHAWLI